MDDHENLGWDDIFELDSHLQERLQIAVLTTMKEVHTLRLGQTFIMEWVLENDCSRTAIQAYILELLKLYFFPTFNFHMMSDGNICISRNEHLIQGLTPDEFNSLACFEPPVHYTEDLIL